MVEKNGSLELVGMAPAKQRKGWNFLRGHSLSLVSVAFLGLWLVLYSQASPKTHWGAFFGNAAADWSGSVVIILGTKYFLEAGSAESRPVRGRMKNAVLNLLRRHSLLLFLVITGLSWVLLYRKSDPNSKWGQIIGNIVSEWLQMIGLVFLTKGLIERGSKESRS